MSAPGFFPDDDRGFAEIERAVGRALDLDVRLPGWPFRAARGFVTIYEYDIALSGSFGDALDALVKTYGDETVSTVGLSPTMPYYRDEYHHYSAFQVDGASVCDDYSAAMYWEPDGDPTGALVFSLNTFGIAGSSGAWSVWAQRDWELGLLLTLEPVGAWLDSGVPWFGRDIDLDSIRSPEGWGMPLSEDDLATFWRNVRERGSGPGDP